MSRELGEKLHDLRVGAGLGIDELAAKTRIASRHIEALEEGRLDLLPGPFFVKGFIRSICSELGRDPDPLLQIVNDLQEEESSVQENGSNGTNVSTTRKIVPLWLTGAVLVALVLGGIWLYGSGKEEPPVETPPEPIATLPEPAPPQEAVIPTVAPAEEPPEELDLTIRAIERTWLRIQTDFSPAWETTLKTGDEIRLEGKDRISLLIGNAGGVLFELNGRMFGPPGSSGQVLSNYVITRDNL